MKKTILRTVNTQSVNSISESLNTTTRFTGLNDSTNFTSVDQNSFSDCNNVFVNADDELSTRPPVVIQDFDVGTIKNIQQVNNLTFYITTDCVIHWKHNNSWESIQCEEFEDIYITDYDDYYLIFTRDSAGTVSLTGLKYLFDSDTFETYTSEELIYIPLTIVYYGATTNDSAESKNLLTTAFRSQYIFSLGITTPSSYLNGKTVMISFDDEEYTLIWDETIPQRFCKNIGTIRVSQDDTVIFDHVRINDNGIYFAWFDYDKNDANHMYAMYSLDGNVWGRLTYPSTLSDSTNKYFTYTDNGFTVWLYEYVFDNHEDDTDVNPTTNIYYIILSTTVQDYSVWQSITIDTFATTNHFCTMYSKTNLYNETSVTFVATDLRYITSVDGNNNTVIHAAEDGEFVAIICVTNIRGGVSETTESFSDDVTTIEWTDTTTHFDSNVSTSTLLGGFILVTCKDYAIVSSGLYAYPEYPINIQKTVLYYQPNDNLSLIFVGHYFNEDNTLYDGSNINMLQLECYGIAVDENLIPYYNYTDCYPNSSILSGLYWLPRCSFLLYLDNTDMALTYEHLLSANNALRSNNIDGKFYLQIFCNMCDSDNTKYPYRDEVSLYSQTNDLEISSKYNDYKDLLTSRTLSLSIDDLNKYDILYVDSLFSIIGIIDSTVIYEYDSWSDNLDKYYASNKILKTTTDDALTGLYIATCLYYYLNGVLYEYLDIYNSNVQMPIDITTSGYITYATEDNKIYTNYFDDEWSVYYTHSGKSTLLMPLKIENFITHTFIIDNLLYQSQSRTIEDDAGLLYIPENGKVVLPTQITESVVFSQTVLAIFTDTTAYEYTYDSDNDVYRLYPTKLQLGNREGYEICTAFDGLTIYMSTVFGYKSLTYESFVQSTEQAFTDCCAAINSIFNNYDDAPIKQAQYNYWIFLYKQTSNQMLIYDTRYDDSDYDNIRYPAWFKWTLPYNINKIWYEGRTFYLWLADNNIYTMEFTDTSIYDITAISKQPITWFVRSQKLHFSYPAYYKHVSMFTSITLQNDIKLRYNIKFYNYRNAYDTEHIDTVEYPIETLGICNKRVNFMKTNAFQYEISNDDTDQYPSRFVLSSIVIKYRITEKIR